MYELFKARLVIGNKVIQKKGEKQENLLSCNIWLIPIVGFFYFFLSCGYGCLIHLDKFDIFLYIWLILPVGYLF